MELTIDFFNTKNAMDKIKNMLAVIILLSISFVALSCDDDDEVSRNKGLVQLDKNKSFSLLTISLSDANVAVDKVTAFVEKYDPAVMTIKNVVYNNQVEEFKDMVTEIAYHSSFETKQPLQGIFSGTSYNLNKATGVGLFMKETFAGTSKEVIDNVLTLHKMKNVLTEGDVVYIAGCEFDRENTSTMEAQASALRKYAGQITENTIIAATIHADENSSVINSLKEVYNLTCSPAMSDNGKRPTPEYLLTPKNQNWGVKYASIVGDESMSEFKGLFFRVGLTD